MRRILDVLITLLAPPIILVLRCLEAAAIVVGIAMMGTYRMSHETPELVLAGVCGLVYLAARWMLLDVRGY